MVAKLAPLDLSGYIAGNSLAARLIAQAGESIGQGYAALGQGIADGVHAAVQKRERKKDIAREEARFQQTRADRQAEQVRDDARMEAQLKIQMADRNQAAIETRLAKLAQEKNDRLTVDPHADITDILERERTATLSHQTMDNVRMESLNGLLHQAAHPEASGDGDCPT